MGWFNSVKNTIENVANSAENAVDKGLSAAESATKSATEAAINETESLGQSLAAQGIDVTDILTPAAQWAGDALEDGAELAYTGMVAAGEELSENACSIVVGSALGAAVAVLSADGEEEGAMALLAIATAAANTTKIKSVALVIATGITEAVWKIPNVSSSGVPKDVVIKVIQYTIIKATEEKKEEVVATGGQFIIGVLLMVLTGLICSGELPGGYKVWEGLNSAL